jgi:hypothetical protein
VQVFALASNSLALMITLSVGLLVIFQRPRSRQPLGQFLESRLLQSGRCSPSPHDWLTCRTP